MSPKVDPECHACVNPQRHDLPHTCSRAKKSSNMLTRAKEVASSLIQSASPKRRDFSSPMSVSPVPFAVSAGDAGDVRKLKEDLAFNTEMEETNRLEISSLEERVQELEKRVQELEGRLGESAGTKTERSVTQAAGG